jgi:hypothetical protein
MPFARFSPPIHTNTQPLTPIEVAWTLIPGVLAVAAESIRKRFASALFGRGPWRRATEHTTGQPHGGIARYPRSTQKDIPA